MTKLTPNLVSAIIPVYNRPNMIVTAVNSVLEQTYRPIEIILVNDGSTDNTGEVIDGLRDQNPTKVKVIHKKNNGPGLARETGRQIACGEYIQYLDSDDWLLPNKFEDQVNALNTNPDCGIAYGISRLVNIDGKILKEPSKWTGRKIEYLFPSLLIDRWWHTHTPLYRREVSDAAGAWSKQRPEDWDLEARMGASQVKLINCKRVVSCHLDHATPGRVSRGDLRSYLKDEAWFLPRLYRCAIKAGITKNQPEMKHFTTWVFMRARYLGAFGEDVLANQLMLLAKESSEDHSAKRKLVQLSADLIGWPITGKFCHFLEKILPR